jgi:circadian clock protein KaiC
MDVWMLLGNPEANGERNRTIQIVKARGMAHSNQVREFVMTAHGVVLLDVSRRADGSVAIGSARGTQQQALISPCPDPASRKRPSR